MSNMYVVVVLYRGIFIRG